MLHTVYETLATAARGDDWLTAVVDRARQRLQDHPHGDLARWRRALENLPAAAPFAKLDHPAPQLGSAVSDPEALQETLMALHPWRKGPLRLGGVTIDTEWRSDFKWRRIEPHVDLRGRRVLDVGCGNGYYGWRMLGAGARMVIGVDPAPVFVMQWLACLHFAGDLPNYVLPLGIEDLPPPRRSGFDTVFSMGVLYHRRDPLKHLGKLRSLLVPGGTLVLESLVLPEDRADEVLVPPGRYARMRNVWAVPGTARVLGWLQEAGFRAGSLADITATTPEEQRQTAWMTFESLQQALDPADPHRTIEGHPAPIRALFIARA